MSWLREILFRRRHMKACQHLAKMTEERRNSFEAEQYRRRRAAALKASRA